MGVKMKNGSLERRKEGVFDVLKRGLPKCWCFLGQVRASILLRVGAVVFRSPFGSPRHSFSSAGTLGRWQDFCLQGNSPLPNPSISSHLGAIHTPPQIASQPQLPSIVFHSQSSCIHSFIHSISCAPGIISPPHSPLLFSNHCLTHASILSTLLSTSSAESLLSSTMISSSYDALASSRSTCMISESMFSWSLSSG